MTADTVKEKLPAPVGVPASPPPAARVNPGGSVPAETVKTADGETTDGASETAAVSASEYGAPMVAPASVESTHTVDSA
jgi:hypothetical protein